ncbi:recombinase family protein [Nocardia sp. bgisy118]|uniref:recombinase family protein n=1 Tax=Nocardia sp. bgisy118 TaxID=3413786 RepID=UPI003F4A6035
MRCPVTVLAHVVAMYRDGRSCAAIARALTEAGVPKPAGGLGWQRCHVWRLVRTSTALTIMADLE